VSASASETKAFARDQAVAATMSPTARALAAVTKTTGVTTSGFVLLGIAVLAWLVGYFVGGRPLYLLSYGLVGIFAMAYPMGRRPLPLEGDRSQARARLAEGETIAVQLSLNASRRLSTFILEEEIPATLGPPARVPVATLEAGESVDHSYELTLQRRGA
jgi:uncharacterized protein (DUF58 family)